MLLTLEQVKSRLGIADDDTSDDQVLTEDIQNATAWIESQTHRRFDVPQLIHEYRNGTDRYSMYLTGNIDVAVPSVDDILIQERTYPADAWITIESTQYERRENEVIRIDGMWWSAYYEYHLQYYDGYRQGFAPKDIQSLALELVLGQYNADADLTSDASGLTSETLVGVYSYTVSESAGTTAGAIGGGTMSDIGLRTLARWQRRFV